MVVGDVSARALVGDPNVDWDSASNSTRGPTGSVDAPLFSFFQAYPNQQVLDLKVAKWQDSVLS
jgi:hypothetical protein